MQVSFRDWHRLNARADHAGCFHCGQPLPTTPWLLDVDGVRQAMCCPGCRAVAQLIVDNGCTAYYRQRSALPAGPQAVAGTERVFGIYDHPDVQRSFVYKATAHNREATLLLEGLTCGACVWLIEQRLAKIAGVRSVAINYATRRARVQWDDERTKLSLILMAIAELGYGVQPYDTQRAGEALVRERKSMLLRLLIAGIGMMQVMMYAVPAYISDGQMGADIEQLMRLASLILTTPVALWSAMPFYLGAWRELRTRRIGMDTPVALGVVAAYGASLLATFRGTGDVYFDSVAMFVFLLLGARFLELTARSKAAQAQERLAGLVPQAAERLDAFPDPQRCERVPAISLKAGDYVAVPPGAAIPADCVIVEGSSSVDEALLTGESRPVPKGPGDAVRAGSVNLDNPIAARVDAVGPDTVIAGIARLMDRAQSEKPRIATAADRAARLFVAAILVLALVAGIAWFVVDATQALPVVIAVLVITCPCALSLATPAALGAATGTLQRAGILVTRGHALETLARATHYVFDKTGTLTQGKMRVVGVIPLSGESRQRCLELAAGLEAGSEHAIGRAIVAEAPPGYTRATAVRNVPGHGIEGHLDGRRARIGTLSFVGEIHRRPEPQELAYVTDEVSVVALGDDQGWIALVTLDDTVRGDARRLITELAARGKEICVLSGDHGRRVTRLARQLGIANAYGDAKPEDKLHFVQALQRQRAVVAVIGDGVNDAPVLAQAQVSIAMASGTDLAQISADMVLMGEGLAPVGIAAATARRTMAIIRQNLAWAALYNAVALPLAMLGHVTPLLAALGMSLSSLAVVLNALRLTKGGWGVHALLGAREPQNDFQSLAPAARN